MAGLFYYVSREDAKRGRKGKKEKGEERKWEIREYLLMPALRLPAGFQAPAPLGMPMIHTGSGQRAKTPDSRPEAPRE